MKRSRILGAVAMSAAACLWTPTRADERDIYDGMVEQAANTCANYVGKTGAPAIRSLKIEIVRVLAARRVLLCPDTSLPGGQDVVWYGNQRAMVWNTSAEGSTAQVRSVLDKMTRDDAFPAELRVWNAKGEELKNQTVPVLKTNCQSWSARGCPSR